MQEGDIIHHSHASFVQECRSWRIIEIIVPATKNVCIPKDGCL